jgi:hypothetical protein
MGNRILLLAVPVLFFLTLLSAGPACAVEQLRGIYPTGAEDCYAGCLPPPGTYFINYNLYLTWDTLKDADGHTVHASGAPKHADNFFTVARFIKGTGCKIFGADWYMHILIPFNYTHVDGIGTNSTLHNITINPMILGWHLGDWHLATGVDLNIAAPGWKKGELNGFATGYYNVEPIFAVTYAKSGFEINAKFMYDYNFTNWQTHYQSGQEFHFDYAIAQKFKNGFLAGLGGYAYWQTTKDKDHGHNVDDSDKTRAFAVGPIIRYDYKNMWFLLKYYRDFEVQRTFEGNWIWFKWFYAF